MDKGLDAKQRIDFLRKKIDKHNHNYYTLSQPTISDYDFDKLLEELISLEKENPQFFDANSPTQRIGSDINIEFEQKPHQYPMLSLGNTYSKTEIKDFYDRISKILDHPPQFVCELKYDGTSISLKYVKGELVQALTRGDGQVGDNVTSNIKTIKSIPLKLNGENYSAEFEIRGEIFMPFDVFEQLNIERKKKGEPLFSNPRNSASGTLKIQNSSIVAKRKLDCYVYAYLGTENMAPTHYEQLKKIKTWGFKVSPDYRFCKNLDEVYQFIDFWNSKRNDLNVATDGIVIKVNAISQQEILGSTSKSPRWAIAFKYQSEQAITKLLSVSYQVGRTGAITPVANLEKVLLAGTMVKRASLHNEDIIKKLDLHSDDTVIIEKGGEIIPKVIKVDKTKRVIDAEKIKFIEYCPDCHTKLLKNDDEANHFCPNDKGCPTQIKEKIKHFVQRRAMDIDGLGKETIELLYNHKLIHNIADLYALRVEDMIHLEGLGLKSAKKILDGLEASKKIPFERVLYGIGIRHVGETVAKKITQKLLTIDEIMNSNVEYLISIDEIGEKIAHSVFAFFKSDENKELIERLRNYGLQFTNDKDLLQNLSEKLKGLRIVISGTFSKHSRSELKNLIEQNGGKNASSVSRSTNYLLAGENIGPQKLAKANEYGIKIISEDEFINMLN